MRPLLASAVITALVLLAAAAPASARSSWCSPSGDACTSVPKRDGVQRLRLGTFSFRGKVKVCVTPPRGSVRCRSFSLREGRRGIYEVDVRWSASFPDRGAGTYRVTFRPDATGGRKYGPTLSFRR